MVPPDMLGNMADAGASPNDPFFIIHHTMIDCVFDEWLKRHPDEAYPDVPLTLSTRGHQSANSFMIPFFPLYTNSKMFKPARNNFGYFCDLPNISGEEVGSVGSSPNTYLSLLTWWSIIFLSIIAVY